MSSVGELRPQILLTDGTISGHIILTSEPSLSIRIGHYGTGARLYSFLAMLKPFRNASWLFLGLPTNRCGPSAHMGGGNFSENLRSNLLFFDEVCGIDLTQSLQ